MIKKTTSTLLVLLLSSMISTTKAETSSPSEQDEEVTRFEEWGIETMKEWEKHTPVLSLLHYGIALFPLWHSAEGYLYATDPHHLYRLKSRIIHSLTIYSLSLLYKKWIDEISSKIKFPIKKKRGEFLSLLNKSIASNCFVILTLTVFFWPPWCG